MHQSLNRSKSACTHDQHTHNALKRLGFCAALKMQNTLQGSIWRAFNHSETTSIIKVTDILLYAKSEAIVGDETCKVLENILAEQMIMKYLSKEKDCTSHIVKHRNFYQTFVCICWPHFVWNPFHAYTVNRRICWKWKTAEVLCSILWRKDTVKIHNFQILLTNTTYSEYVVDGSIDIAEWQKVAKVILKQMIDCIEYIHSKNVCHFDISLENWLINDVNVEVDKYANGVEKLRFITDSIHIKLCDFGTFTWYTIQFKTMKISFRLSGTVQ